MRGQCKTHTQRKIPEEKLLDIARFLSILRRVYFMGRIEGAIFFSYYQYELLKTLIIKMLVNICTYRRILTLMMIIENTTSFHQYSVTGVSLNFVHELIQSPLEQIPGPSWPLHPRNQTRRWACDPGWLQTQKFWTVLASHLQRSSPGDSSGSDQHWH